MNGLENYSNDRYARQIFLYLLTGTLSPKYFDQYAVKNLNAAVAQSLGKKDPAQRLSELQSSVFPLIREKMWNVDFLKAGDGKENIVLEIFRNGAVDEKQGCQDLVSWISNDKTLLTEKSSSSVIRSLLSSSVSESKTASALAHSLKVLFESNRSSWLTFLTGTEAIRILISLVKSGLFKVKRNEIAKNEEFAKLQALLIQ